MLNGIAPIILFNFLKTKTNTSSKFAKIPLVADVVGTPKNLLAPIPIYLDEKLTGLCIVTESKNIDIATDTVATSDSSEDAIQNQSAFSSTITITMKARRGTIGMALLSGIMDLIFKKVTANEYTITYLHGSIILFGGLLHSFEINETEDNDLSEIKIVLINPAKQKMTANIGNVGGAPISGVAAVHP